MAYRLRQNSTRADDGPRSRRRLRDRTISVAPTVITLGNLLCGFAAIFMASRPIDASLPYGWSPLAFAAMFIFLGMVFDGLDGRVARMTRSESELGEQLDSLADMVNFGVAPAFLVLQFARVGTPFLSTMHDVASNRVTLAIAGIYVACAALRLARFNVEVENEEEADHHSFSGLPTPGAAGAIAALVLLHEHLKFHRVLEASPTSTMQATSLAVVLATLLASFGMVSRIRYTHVLNLLVRRRVRQGKLPLGAIAIGSLVVVLLAVSPQGAIAGALVIYALSGPAAAIWRQARGGDAAQREREQERDRLADEADLLIEEGYTDDVDFTTRRGKTIANDHDDENGDGDDRDDKDDHAGGDDSHRRSAS